MYAFIYLRKSDMWASSAMVAARMTLCICWSVCVHTNIHRYIHATDIYEKERDARECIHHISKNWTLGRLISARFAMAAAKMALSDAQLDVTKIAHKDRFGTHNILVTNACMRLCLYVSMYMHVVCTCTVFMYVSQTLHRWDSLKRMCLLNCLSWFIQESLLCIHVSPHTRTCACIALVSLCISYTCDT